MCSGGGADFVAAMQLMIYVGGTLVLLIFGVMLTAQARFISMKTSGGEWLLAAFAAIALLGMLVPAGNTQLSDVSPVFGDDVGAAENPE